MTEQQQWTGTHDQVYAALARAAERMGHAGYRAQLAAHRKQGRAPGTFRFAVTKGHQEVVDMMAALCWGTVGPEEAMNLLWRGDILHQRTQEAAQ